ncbi:MAG TPA: energy transducer TonB [Sphingomonadaceae bacterium]|nr:energy transducer TonB [Sphingomonadaceae bacterium]
MHAAYRRSSNRPDVAFFHASFPFAPQIDQVEERERSTYGEGRRPNWLVIFLIVALHAVILVAITRAHMLEVKKAPPPLVVNLITLQPPPPERTSEPTPPKQVAQPEIISPPPLVRAATPAPAPVLVAATPPPPQMVAVAPPAPKAIATTTDAGDLSSTMISAKPPRYPIESRRKHEEGTVTLRLTLGPDGGVADIVIAHSSGFVRLDKAAIDAVRHWRWSPMIRDGRPVSVRGIVEIPFILKG